MSSPKAQEIRRLRDILFTQFLRIELWRPCIDKRFIRMNDRIRAREVRVIDDETGQLGIMPPFEALKLAKERGLDLVEISPTAQPPVCFMSRRSSSETCCHAGRERT